MAERLDLLYASAWESGGSSGGAQPKGWQGGLAGRQKGLVHSMEGKKEDASKVAFIKGKYINQTKSWGRATLAKRKSRVLLSAITMATIVSFAIVKNGRRPRKSLRTQEKSSLVPLTDTGR